MYTLPGLEEGTEYSITVTATITEEDGGGTQQYTITETTKAAGENSLSASISDYIYLSLSSLCPSLFCESLSGELHCHLCPVGTSGTLC